MTQEPPAPPPYRSLRYDEDYRYLRDPARRTDPFDPLKYVALDKDGRSSLSLGGEARVRYEYLRNPGWGDGPEQDGYLLQRYMLHGDLRLGEPFRIFAQLKSGLEHGRSGGPRPADEDRLDVHQAFADGSVALSAEDSLTFRLGRQELSYGSARLISTRDGPNVRQSFDGLKTMLRFSRWNADAFVSHPAETEPGVFDDGSDEDRTFWGLYATTPPHVLPGLAVDFYYLGLDREDATFDQGTAHEVRHTFGTRLFGDVGRMDYNFEAIWQIGRFGSGDIRAWSLASDTGVTLDTVPWKPRLGLKADIASGDPHPSSEDLGTFNALFPKGNYFSEAAILGPANFIDLHPSLSIQPLPDVTVTADADFFWRQSTRDGIYGNAGNLLASGRASSERYVGSQISLAVEWQIQRHVAMTVVYTHFDAGPFLKDVTPGKAIDFMAAWITFTF